MSAGRQSPPPSRQTGSQQSDIPGWSGKTESPNGHANGMYNPSAHTSHAKPSKQDIEEHGERQNAGSGGVENLESNPVHPLAEVAKGKIH
ncbi:hypothetical protein LOZ65_005130 [Ophidiomyces ophidiicola]|nr:hypothetical protein LOZ65_005130 [Ophidiomyces ophidiicola]